jgi:hypothetical protein
MDWRDITAVILSVIGVLLWEIKKILERIEEILKQKR